MPDEKRKRIRRTKAQLEAAKNETATRQVLEASESLSKQISIAPPEDLLAKTGRAILGNLKLEWDNLLLSSGYPSDFQIAVRVVGREAMVDIQYTRTHSIKRTVIIDDGEKELPLAQSTAKAAEPESPSAAKLVEGEEEPDLM